MARISKTDVLVLSTLARVPMHGYELKLELRYKHVNWWARCDHGHIYTSLTRLDKRGFIEALPVALAVVGGATHAVSYPPVRSRGFDACFVDGRLAACDFFAVNRCRRPHGLLISWAAAFPARSFSGRRPMGKHGER